MLSFANSGTVATSAASVPADRDVLARLLPAPMLGAASSGG